ncbi:Probable intracellular septation protein A [Buchnera aphidicola (Eriosoma grossulariae)]
MKILLNIFSMLVFFIIYHIFNIFIATMLLMISSGIFFFTNYIFYKKIDYINLISFLSIFLFGFLTIFFHNSLFIKWKVTIVYFALSLILLIHQFKKKKTLLQIILNQEIHLSDVEWEKLNISWSIFFLICSILNLYIAYYCSEICWIYFKTLGLSVITMLFILINIIYIYYKNNK